MITPLIHCYRAVRGRLHITLSADARGGFQMLTVDWGGGGVCLAVDYVINIFSFLASRTIPIRQS